MNDHSFRGQIQGIFGLQNGINLGHVAAKCIGLIGSLNEFINLLENSRQFFAPEGKPDVKTHILYEFGPEALKNVWNLLAINLAMDARVPSGMFLGKNISIQSNSGVKNFQTVFS